MYVNRISEALMALFHQVWAASAMAIVLVLLIVVLQGVLKHHLKPRWHYLMWLFVIVRLIMPWGPESEFSIYNWIGNTGSVSSAVQPNLAESQPTAEVHDTLAQFIYSYLWMVWLAGAGLLGAYSLTVNLRFARKTRNEISVVTDARLLRIFNECKQMMSTGKSIILVESPSAATPSLFGFLNPRLILPQGIAQKLNDAELRHVFLHEWAHRRRNDIWVNSCMHVLLIVHWFNPFLWYAAGRMREDQELASDALALSCLAPDQRLSYGHTLIKLLENCSQPLQIAGNVNLAGSKKQLQRRIQMIARFKSNSYRWSVLGIATLIFISGCALTNPKDSKSASQAPDYTLSEKQSATAPPAQSSPNATALPSSKADTPSSVSGDVSAKPSDGKQSQVNAPAAPAEAAPKPVPASANPAERPRAAAPATAAPPGQAARTESSSIAVSGETAPRLTARTESSSSAVSGEPVPRPAARTESSSSAVSEEAAQRQARMESSSSAVSEQAALRQAAPVPQPSAAAKTH